MTTNNIKSITKEVHPVSFDKLRDYLFKSKGIDEEFEFNQIQTELANDNNNLQTWDGQKFLCDLIAVGEVTGIKYKRTGIKLSENELPKKLLEHYENLLKQYKKLLKIKSEQKEPEPNTERIPFIKYEEFSSLVLKHWIKSELITAQMIREYLNSLNIFLPYTLLREHMDEMEDNNKIMYYKGRRYQIIV